MHKFVRNLLTEWRRLNLPFANETVLIAVSGGADSVALTLALNDLQQAKKLNLNFVAAHFNHGLRGAESGADEKFVKDLSEKIEFKFITKIRNRKSEIRNQKGNLEQNAREARYDFLRQTAEEENAFAVLTAHTVNDQAETLLLNLIRGSGIEGLGGMRKIRELEKIAKFSQSEIRNPKSKIVLVRPLLGWAKREDTENFAHEKEIDFRQDSMNADEKFSRVKIRKKLIPMMRELNPKIVETLARTAFLLQKDASQSSVIDNQLTENLSIKELQNLSQSELYEDLRRWLKMMRGNLRRITSAHIQAIERLISSRKSGRKAELPGGDLVIKKGGEIFFEKSKVEKRRSGN